MNLVQDAVDLIEDDPSDDELLEEDDSDEEAVAEEHGSDEEGSVLMDV